MLGEDIDLDKLWNHTTNNLLALVGFYLFIQHVFVKDSYSITGLYKPETKKKAQEATFTSTVTIRSELALDYGQ